VHVIDNRPTSTRAGVGGTLGRQVGVPARPARRVISCAEVIHHRLPAATTGLCRTWLAPVALPIRVPTPARPELTGACPISLRALLAPTMDAIDLLLAHGDYLAGATEDQIREAALRAAPPRQQH
jgi:hypothetical protein